MSASNEGVRAFSSKSVDSALNHPAGDHQVIAEHIATDSNVNVERLQRRLSNCETTIVELMSLSRATSILKEKLTALDELILDIPSQCEDMAQQWRVKVAGWWRQYAAYSATVESASGAQVVQQAALIRQQQPHQQSSINTGGWSPMAVPSAEQSWLPYHSPRAYLLPSPQPKHQQQAIMQPPLLQLPQSSLTTLQQLQKNSSSINPKPIGPQTHRTTDQTLLHWPQVQKPPPSASSSMAVGSPIRPNASVPPFSYANAVMRVSSSVFTQAAASTSSSSHSSQFNLTSSSTSTAIGAIAPRFGSSPSLPQFPDVYCYNNFAGPMTKHTIRIQLEAAFDQLPSVCDGTLVGFALYVDGLQKLLAAVAKAINVLIPYTESDDLLLEMAQYAVAKLPPEKQIEFNGRYERKSLDNLMRFLRKEIVIYYEKCNVGTIALMEVKQGGDFGDQQSYCVYCRRDGHRVHECPIKRSMLCFKCYEFGHTHKCCPNSDIAIRGGQ